MPGEIDSENYFWLRGVSAPWAFTLGSLLKEAEKVSVVA